MVSKLYKSNSLVVFWGFCEKVFVTTFFWILETLEAFDHYTNFFVNLEQPFVFHSTIICMGLCTKKIWFNWLPPSWDKGHLVVCCNNSQIAIIKWKFIIGDWHLLQNSIYQLGTSLFYTCRPPTRLRYLY